MGSGNYQEEHDFLTNCKRNKLILLKNNLNIFEFLTGYFPDIEKNI